MRKFVWIAVFVSSLITGLEVRAVSNKENQANNTSNDSLIVYQAENDSLKAELIEAGALKMKAKSNSFKRMETAWDDEKTPVHPRDLPNAIKETLSGDQFKDWKTTSVSFVKTTKGKSYYEIALLKENDAKIAKFKGNGKVL